MRCARSISGMAFALAAVAPVAAAEINVAVAANFTKPAQELAAAFKAGTGDDIILSFGATGTLYAQIAQGAPFAVFLAADSKRPAQAVAEGLGVEGTAFTYAAGKVALYSPSIDVSDGATVLASVAIQHVAIADPATAPYGAAALEALEKLGLTAAVASKLVTGENVAQALQFIESGSAELGFVALSQVPDRPASHIWVVPAGYHAPILQDAVLLKAGEGDPVARAFLDFLRSDEARAIIASHGYEVPQR